MNCNTLKQFFENNSKAAIAFSGGVDSAYLLYAAAKCGADVQPYYVKTPFQPQFEYEDAKRLCKRLAITLKVIEYDILSDTNIVKNPKNRCYHCKKAIFALLKKRAVNDGYTLIIDGTNASDDADDRPGMKALEELGVRSPLRECGLGKDEIRKLSKENGLFTWDKPSYACLATRIPCGTEITEDLLKRVEKSEDKIRLIGFSDFRVRVYGEAARLQIKDEQFSAAAEKRMEIIECIKPYFDTILLDMEAR